MDQWHSYPFQYRLLEFAFTTWLLPQSALTLPGALNLVCPIHSILLPVEVLSPPSIWAATTQPVKPHFLFICHSIFASSDLNPSHGWTQTLPTNTMTNPTTKHTHGYSTMSQNQGGEVLLEQNREWDSHRAMKNKDPAIILWSQHLSSGGYGLQPQP